MEQDDMLRDDEAVFHVEYEKPVHAFQGGVRKLHHRLLGHRSTDKLYDEAEEQRPERILLLDPTRGHHRKIIPP
jgi:hypothetical protein